MPRAHRQGRTRRARQQRHNRTPQGADDGDTRRRLHDGAVAEACGTIHGPRVSLHGGRKHAGLQEKRTFARSGLRHARRRKSPVLTGREPIRHNTLRDLREKNAARALQRRENRRARQLKKRALRREAEERRPALHAGGSDAERRGSAARHNKRPGGNGEDLLLARGRP